MSSNDARLRSCQVRLLSLNSLSQQIVERVLCDKRFSNAQLENHNNNSDNRG